jgi:hypothetical protein
MRSFRATPANSYHPTRIHPALSSFADECCGTLARLVAYVGFLALLAMVGVYLWDQLPDVVAIEPSAKAGWSIGSRAYPAFAVSQLDLPSKTETYEVFRHPEGGRKDVFRWSAQNGNQPEKPVAELEIYRPGAEFDQSRPASAEMAARMDPDGGRELEAAGIIDSKFGAVTLLRLSGYTGRARSCLGFVTHRDQPHLQISGWSCQGETWPARRAAVSCMLSRLELLAARNDPKLVELFARAELKRGSCAASATPAASADWVTGAQNPRLRGTL